MVLWRGLTGPSPQRWLRQSRVRGRTGIDSCRLSCSLNVLASNRVLWSHRFVCCMGEIRGTQSNLYSPPKARSIVGLQEYRSEIASKMSDAWELARQCIGKTQKRQKTFYDQRSRSAKFRLETVLSCLSRQPRLGRHASLQGLSMDPIVFWS